MKVDMNLNDKSLIYFCKWTVYSKKNLCRYQLSRMSPENFLGIDFCQVDQTSPGFGKISTTKIYF